MVAMQRAVACVSAGVVRFDPEPGATFGLAVATPMALPATNLPDVRVTVRQWVMPLTESDQRRGWKAQLAGYSYRLNSGQQELLLYHWHPQGPSHLVDPHLHPGPPLLAALGTKRAVHLPTGEIRLSDFVTMLIREFGVRARRRDWRSVMQSVDV